MDYNQILSTISMRKTSSQENQIKTYFGQDFKIIVFQKNNLEFDNQNSN